MSEHRIRGRCVRLGRPLAGGVLAAVLFGGLPDAASAQVIEFDNEKVLTYALFDVLEVAPNVNGRPVEWDFIGWIGKDYTRFWIKTDGGLSTDERAGEMEFQTLYSRLIAPYWELQMGVRADVAYDGDASRTRAHLVFGLEGLAPYWFELEPALFISQDGDVSANLTATYDMFMTQRMILQPRLDLSAAVQEVEEWGVGSGLNSFGLGLRLRYEIRREFAPYLGVSWTRLTGGTADLARLEGEDPDVLGLVAGFRLWR